MSKNHNSYNDYNDKQYHNYPSSKPYNKNKHYDDGEDYGYTGSSYQKPRNQNHGGKPRTVPMYLTKQTVTQQSEVKPEEKTSQEQKPSVKLEGTGVSTTTKRQNKIVIINETEGTSKEVKEKSKITIIDELVNQINVINATHVNSGTQINGIQFKSEEKVIVTDPKSSKIVNFKGIRILSDVDISLPNNAKPSHIHQENVFVELNSQLVQNQANSQLVQEDQFICEYGSFFPDDSVVFEHQPESKTGINQPIKIDSNVAKLTENLHAMLNIQGKSSKTPILIVEESENKSQNAGAAFVYNLNGKNSHTFDKIYKQYPHLNGLRERVRNFWIAVLNATNDELEAFDIVKRIKPKFIEDDLDFTFLLLDLYWQAEKYDLIKELLEFDKSLKKDRDIGEIIDARIIKLLPKGKINRKNKECHSLDKLTQEYGIEPSNMIFMYQFTMMNNKIMKVDEFERILSSHYITIHYEYNPYQTEMISLLQFGLETGEIYLFDLVEICKFVSNIQKVIEFICDLVKEKRSSLITFKAKETFRLIIKSLSWSTEYKMDDLIEKKTVLCRLLDEYLPVMCDMKLHTKHETIRDVAINELGLKAYPEQIRYYDWDCRPLKPVQKEFAALEVQTLQKFYMKLFAEEDNTEASKA